MTMTITIIIYSGGDNHYGIDDRNGWNAESDNKRRAWSLIVVRRSPCHDIHDDDIYDHDIVDDNFDGIDDKMIATLKVKRKDEPEVS